MNEQFEVLGYVMPGASFKLVTDSVKNDNGNLTMYDFLIICSGSNYTNINDLRNVLHDVTRFAKSIIQTNVVLVSIPYRHNLIKIFNRKLCKSAKIFSHVKATEADNDRQLFTTHGLHLNRLGKELILVICFFLSIQLWK